MNKRIDELFNKKNLMLRTNANNYKRVISQEVVYWLVQMDDQTKSEEVTFESKPEQL